MYFELMCSDLRGARKEKVGISNQEIAWITSREGPRRIIAAMINIIGIQLTPGTVPQRAINVSFLELAISIDIPGGFSTKRKSGKKSWC